MGNHTDLQRKVNDRINGTLNYALRLYAPTNVKNMKIPLHDYRLTLGHMPWNSLKHR
jgi:hypothetical protein